MRILMMRSSGSNPSSRGDRERGEHISERPVHGRSKTGVAEWLTSAPRRSRSDCQKAAALSPDPRGRDDPRSRHEWARWAMGHLSASGRTPLTQRSPFEVRFPGSRSTNRPQPSQVRGAPPWHRFHVTHGGGNAAEHDGLGTETPHQRRLALDRRAARHSVAHGTGVDHRAGVTLSTAGGRAAATRRSRTVPGDSTPSSTEAPDGGPRVRADLGGSDGDVGTSVVATAK